MGVSPDTIRQWLPVDEDIEHIIEERFGLVRQILAVTSKRAVLFQRNLGGRLRDKSDKLWRQLIEVHLEERLLSSKLTIKFFRYDDSIIYHNPHRPSRAPVDRPWVLTRLPKKGVRIVYRALKRKERKCKAMKRKEQLECLRAMGGRYLRVEPGFRYTPGDE